MIDIEKIKALPEEKPRKGPHRMGKSEKSRAQEIWRAQRSLQRRIGLERYIDSQAIVPHEVGNPEISVASGVFPIVRRVYRDLVARQLVSVQPMILPAGSGHRRNHD